MFHSLILIALNASAISMQHDGMPDPSVLLNTQSLPKPGSYEVSVPEGKAAWVVKGANLSIDLTGRSLKSRKSIANQSDFVGIGILLDGCKNVTLKNVSVSGFHVNIALRNCINVRILNCLADRSKAIRMSDNGKPIDTFLNLRELNAWRSYGSGFWLENCSQCTISHCRATSAQNGLLMVHSHDSTIYDNTFSYNGGWGIGLWKSSRNTVDWNHADFCNRPWSGGWGGDAAGMVVANGSVSNQIISNSLTFGGDGFFLTDRVNGGFDSATQKFNFDGSSNNNLVAYNDGSWSSNNAFEGTFSEGNTYFHNIANHSNYGFWLGFSSHMFVVQNEIKFNRSEGVAIGQGVNNTLFRNSIEDNRNIGVHIWSDAGAVEKDQPSDQNSIVENRITSSMIAINLDRSTNYSVLGNTIEKATLPKSIRTGFPTLAQTQMLENWAKLGEGRKLDKWVNQRPSGWKFFSETGPMALNLLKLGDYAPAKS